MQIIVINSQSSQLHSSAYHCLEICFNREQEKELLMRKRGKRPRGRPRKVVVSDIQKGMSSIIDFNAFNDKIEYISLLF